MKVYEVYEADNFPLRNDIIIMMVMMMLMMIFIIITWGSSSSSSTGTGYVRNFGHFLQFF